jgi:hypothetical protein
LTSSQSPFSLLDAAQHLSKQSMSQGDSVAAAVEVLSEHWQSAEQRVVALKVWLG